MSNQTARELITEGKIMVSRASKTNLYQHVYYFLYNDCLVLFDDEPKSGDDNDEDEEVRVIPLTHIYCYYIPEEQGVPNAIQLVHHPVLENARITFTILFESSESKSSFIKQVHATYNEITESHITSPVVSWIYLYVQDSNE